MWLEQQQMKGIEYYISKSNNNLICFVFCRFTQAEYYIALRATERMHQNTQKFLKITFELNL